jgi:ADP-ribose pyrophosphatase YjhB (NUDIX family)
MSYIKDIREKVGNDWLILNAACSVIVNDKNQILLQKRSDNQLWGLPGGLLELNESIKEGVVREVKEETNLDLEITGFIGIFNNPFMRWRENDYARIISYAFVGKVNDKLMKINDHESMELKYFNYYDLPRLHSIDTIQIIDAFYNNKRNLVEGELYHE